MVVADVAGKGMGASLIMSTAKAMLPLIATDRSVEESLSELNRRLHVTLDRREFVALVFARYSPESGRLRLANAGLPNPYLIRPGSPPREIDVPGPRLPVAAMKNVRYESIEIVMEPGDRLLIFSDGLPEAPASHGPLGYEALAVLLDHDHSLPAAAWIDALLERTQATTTNGFDDDCTAMVLERTVAGDVD